MTCFVCAGLYTLSHVLDQGPNVAGILYLSVQWWICSVKQFEKCFVDESDRTKTSYPSEGGHFYLGDLRGISISFTVSFKCQSLWIGVTVKSLKKKELIPFEIMLKSVVERQDLVKRKCERKTKLSCAPPQAFRSGSVSLRRCLFLVNGWDSWSRPSRGVQVHE